MAVLLQAFYASAQEGVRWIPSFDAGLAMAKKEHKVLFVYFHADWAGNLDKELNAEVFSKEDFQLLAKRQFVLVRLESPRDGSKTKAVEELEQKFKIKTYPHVLLFTSDGKLIDRIDGFDNGDIYMNDLEQKFPKR